MKVIKKNFKRSQKNMRAREREREREREGERSRQQKHNVLREHYLTIKSYDEYRKQ